MPPIIEVCNLGKSYWISHQHTQRARYVALRDVIVEKARDLLRPGVRSIEREEFWALKDVSFSIDTGDRVGIIGRNGAGKSTLLKVLSRITEPTIGRVVMRGRVASLLEVGTGFHPELTGRENIFLNGAILGMSRSEIMSKFDDIVAFAEVERFLDTPVKRYSSGMHVRLAFAVAAHLEPEILVVDEVLAVGDYQFQKKCLGKMREVGKDGRTVLFVSHNMAAIKQLCDTAIWLKAGRVQAVAPVHEVIDGYMSQSEKAPTRVDLRGIRNSYGNGEIEVLSLEMLNAVGGSFACAWDQPIRLRLGLRVNTPLKGVGIGMSAMSPDGVVAFTVRSEDTIPGGLLEFETIGEKEVDITIDHRFRASLLSLTFGINAGSYVYFYKEWFVEMEIVDSGSSVYRYRNDGFVDCDATWEFVGERTGSLMIRRQEASVL
jgi:lipopolysaccharide transport system ATP-binding protein